MLSSFSHPDIHSVRHQIRSNKADAGSQMRTCQEIARSAACLNTFRNLNPLAIEQSLVCDPQLPLAGLSVSVKDLFDVQGEITTSGGRILESSAPARKDATAVARLKAAGGVVIGRTHMVELAFSGIGINPHFGTPVNPYALQVDPTQPRIPGGSSSGAAVSVASGAAFIGLGSDTGGSLRIPAALCGLVGFKPTASSVPSEGATELSRSLDTVGAITRSVRDAVLSHEILSGHALPESGRQLRDRRFAVVQTLMLNDLDETVSANFEKSLSALRQAGATIQELNLEDIQDLGHIQSRGGFAAPELQTWLIDAGLWPSGKSHIDPRVAERIALADNMKATDYIRLQRARQSWIAKISVSLQEFDAILSPTVPMVAPPIALVAPGHERDAAFFRINALLLRNTSVVNMLDGCAISLPNHAPNSLPTGLMLWHCAHHDEDILHTALQIESIIR